MAIREVGFRADVLSAIVPYETLGALLDELEMFTDLDLLNEDFDHENFTAENCN